MNQALLELDSSHHAKIKFLAHQIHIRGKGYHDSACLAPISSVHDPRRGTLEDLTERLTLATENRPLKQLLSHPPPVPAAAGTDAAARLLGENLTGPEVIKMMFKSSLIVVC